MPEFKPVRVQDKDIAWLTREQQDKVFKFIPPKHIRIFNFLRHYATRLNEACGFLKEDIYKDKGYLVVRNTVDDAGHVVPFTKTKSLRPLPIIPEVDLSDDCGCQFVFCRSGRAYTSKALNRIWSRAMKKAHQQFKVPMINPYNGLRHSWASQRLNEGYSLDEIARVFGHTTTTMSKRYAKYDVGKLVGVIRGKAAVHGVFIGSDKEKTVKNQNGY